MSVTTQRITPFLWFDTQAEEAAGFYIAIFKNSEEASRAAGRPAGSVMVVDFELDGQHFTALNGGPHFKFNEAISLVVHCRSQEEVDHYWSRLGEGGDERAQQCGWLKDRFGVSWQIVPDRLAELLNDRDPAKGKRVMAAMLKMKKIDIPDLERAAKG
jgi:predicted 3-demethylubiquinone-9 3-methyltransferase (glyoxalase superfamily)